MPINPLIPLAVDTTSITGAVRSDRRITDLREQNAVKNEQRERIINLRTRQVKANENEIKRDAEEARVNESIRSIGIFGETQLTPALEAGDKELARRLLTDRKAELDAKGIDSRDTVEGLRLLDDDPDELLRLSKSLTQEARLRKLIPEAAKAGRGVNVTGPDGRLIGISFDGGRTVNGNPVTQGSRIGKPSEPSINRNIVLPILTKILNGKPVTPNEQKAFDEAKSIGIVDQILRGFQPEQDNQKQDNQKQDNQKQDNSQLRLQQAREAIASGEDEDAVRQKLSEMGINPELL